MASHTPIFRFSLLSLALFAGFAQAETTTGNNAELGTINVQGNVSSRIRSDWQSASERSTMNMKDLVSDQVGIAVGGGSVSGQWLSVRGVGQNRVDFVVDGTETDSQLWHHQSRFMFDPAMVKVISADKGAGAASAGIGRTSGTVRAETVDAKDLLLEGQTIGARAGINLNSNKGIGGNLAVYTAQNGFDALLMGSWQNDSDYKDGSGTLMTNTARQQANYLLKLGYAFNPDHQIRASYRREHFYGDNTMRPEYQCFATPSCDVQRGPMEQVQQTTNLQYKGQNLGFARNVDFNVFHIKGEDDRPQFDRTLGGFIPGSRGPHSELETVGANLGFTSEIGNGHLLKYGINWRRSEVSTSSRPTHGENKTDYGIYAEGIWNFNPITLTTGLRYDHFNAHSSSNGSGITRASGSRINPSIGVIWDATPNLALHAKWNQASRSPQLVEAFQTGNSNRGFTAGLKPEVAQLAEIGFKWNQDSEQGFALSGSVFSQRIKNYMNNGQNAMVSNLGTLKINGYELAAAYRTGGLTARISTSRANMSADGFPLPTAGRDIARVGQQWRTSLSYRFDNPNLEIGWRGRYVQGDGIRAVSNGVIYERKGYGVHDLYANWKPLSNDRMNVNFAINNLFDKHYRSHSQTLTSNSTFYEPGREFRLGMNYRF